MRSISSNLTWEFEIRPETYPCLHIRIHLSISSLYANFEWKTTNRIQIYNVPKWFSSLSSFFRVDYESFFHIWKSVFFGYKVRFDKQLQKLLFSKVDCFVSMVLVFLPFVLLELLVQEYLIPKMTSSVAIQYVFISSKMS